MKARTMMDLLNCLLMESDPKELPDADCDNCKFRQVAYAEYRNQHCYMFEESPGDKCAQFKKYKH